VALNDGFIYGAIATVYSHDTDAGEVVNAVGHYGPITGQKISVKPSGSEANAYRLEIISDTKVDATKRSCSG
jgi:hypothetical protein